MATCATCGTTILWGGATADGRRYCSEKCKAADYQAYVEERVPQAVARGVADQIHSGACPKCRQRNGPVDVHEAHWIWSALVVTTWNTTVELSCRGCARKRQLGATAFCGVLGWWGYAGLIGTPIQIVRNIASMLGGPKGDRPSPKLVDVSRHLAAEQGYREEPAEPDPAKPWRRG